MVGPLFWEEVISWEFRKPYQTCKDTKEIKRIISSNFPVGLVVAVNSDEQWLLEYHMWKHLLLAAPVEAVNLKCLLGIYLLFPFHGAWYL